MKLKLKVAKFSDGRKIIELPKAVRDNFQKGQELFLDLKNFKIKVE